MNNQGQVWFYALMVGTVIIILALAFAPGVKNITDDARSATNGMNCSNVNNTDMVKSACIATDTISPLFIGFVLFLGGATILAKVLLQ